MHAAETQIYTNYWGKQHSNQLKITTQRSTLRIIDLSVRLKHSFNQFFRNPRHINVGVISKL